MFKLIKEHKGAALFIGGLVFNLIESLYFGWGTEKGFNFKPESIAEFICDDIAIIMIFVGAYLAGRKMFKESTQHINFSVGTVVANNTNQFINELNKAVSQMNTRE